MARSRVPAHITEMTDRGFGLNVQVNESPLPKVNHPPNGVVGSDGDALSPVFKGYREVIPLGVIGSSEKHDVMLPGPQYVDTVPSYPTEQNDTRLHGPIAALRAADTQDIPLQNYASFQPRTAPMPRAVQDELYLRGFGRNVADPRMTDDDSATMLIPHDAPDRCDLYGKNRDGMLHNPIGEPPEAPKSPTTTAAAAQGPNRQVGRGMTRTPHGQRPSELADKPMSTAKVKA
jgi:hypothetical protein